MRTVHKARLVPDSAPDGLTEKVIRVSDLRVPIEVALGRFEAADPSDLQRLLDQILDEQNIREAINDPA